MHILAMKLSIFVLLALGVSGHTADSNECDATSHLATRSKVKKVSEVPQEIFISELQFPSMGGDNKVEISGPPGDSFRGCLFAVDASGGFVADISGLFSGNFDSNGLLVPVTNVPSTTSPSLVFLSDGCPSLLSGQPLTAAGEVYDSIGVPNSQAQEATLQNRRDILAEDHYEGPGDLPSGTDFKAIPTAQMVFRDGSFGDFYAVTTIGNGPVYDVPGNIVDGSDFDKDPTQPTLGQINPILGGGEMGDPHIHTLAGDHYTLLRQGSFLLWEFSSQKPKVQWQLYAHYAGRQSFTKGLLLVDTSGLKPSAMEITSEECQWQSKGEAKEWSPVTSQNEVVLPTPSSRMKLFGQKRKDIKKIELLVANQKAPVASLTVMCRKGRHINMKLYMLKKKWGPFVSGELKGYQHQNRSSKMKLSTLQLATQEDQEFQVTETWKELGGSSQAEQYLQNLDENPGTVGLIQTCDSQAEAEARAICRKHLGETSNSNYFKECVFDVCSGAGEVAAEMAAEMLNF